MTDCNLAVALTAARSLRSSRGNLEPRRQDRLHEEEMFQFLKLHGHQTFEPLIKQQAHGAF